MYSSFQAQKIKDLVFAMLTFNKNRQEGNVVPIQTKKLCKLNCVPLAVAKRYTSDIKTYC